MLRQRLQDIGVMLPSGRRKQTELSLLTSLVESKCFCGSINYLGRGVLLPQLPHWQGHNVVKK